MIPQLNETINRKIAMDSTINKIKKAKKRKTENEKLALKRGISDSSSPPQKRSFTKKSGKISFKSRNFKDLTLV